MMFDVRIRHADGKMRTRRCWANGPGDAVVLLKQKNQFQPSLGDKLVEVVKVSPLSEPSRIGGE